MSKLNPQRFTSEEFPDQAKWIGKLFSGLNQFTGDVVNAFSNQISVQDNLHQEIKEIKFVNQGSDYPIKFKLKFNQNPRGLTPIYLLNNTTGEPSILQPWVIWTYADGQIRISDISGLTASNTYTIRLLIIYS